MFLVAEILNHLNLDFKDVFKVHLWWCVQVQPSSTVTSQRQLRWIRTGNIWSLCLWVLLKGKASTQTHIIHMCHGQNIPISWVSWPFYKNRLMSIFQSLLVFYVFFWIIYPPGIKNGLLENPSAPLLLVQRPVPGTLPGGLGRINIDAEHWCFFCIFLRRVLYIQYIIQHTKDLLWMFYSISLDFR